MQVKPLVNDDHARHPPVLGSAEERADRVDVSEDLARAFRRGEKWAAERLIQETTPLVTTLVRRLSAWSTDVDDVVHDVFVAALVARKKFRGDAKFETWITRIAINRCRAHNRRQWVRRQLLAAWREKQPMRHESDASEKMAFDERAELVRQAVSQLPQVYREVIVLFYLEQMPAAEVAGVLGIKTNTVVKRLSRARQRLATRLAEGTD